jgi:hypothetical protein
VTHALAAAAAAGNQGTGGTSSSSRSGGDGRDASLPRTQMPALEEVWPLSLRFRNPDLEAAFSLYHRLQYETTWRRVWPAALAVVVLLQVRTVLWDVLVSGDVDPVLRSIPVVVLGVLVPFAFALALAWVPRLLDRLLGVWQWLIALAAATSMGLATVLIAAQSDGDPGFAAATYALTLLVWTCANRARFLFAVASAVPIPIAYGLYFGLTTPVGQYGRVVGILYVVAIFVAVAILVRDMELAMRHQFTHSSFLLRNNAKLRDQLNQLRVCKHRRRHRRMIDRGRGAGARAGVGGAASVRGPRVPWLPTDIRAAAWLPTQTKYTKTGADFDSPLEKVTALMNTLLADSTLGVEQLQLVAAALQLITASNVLQPDLDGQIRAGQVSIDRDTEAWLFTELAQRERTYTANVNKTKDVIAANGGAPAPATSTSSTPGAAPGPAAGAATAAASKPYYMSGLNFDFNPFDAILEGLGLDADEGAPHSDTHTT